MNDYYKWYQILEKPFFSPPAEVFGIAWGIIYPLIAIAFICLVYLLYKKRAKKELLWIFILNMLANIMFTPIQFGLKSNGAAFLVILYILVTLIIFEKKVWSVSKTIFFLMLPYLVWVSFATILQFSIVIMNI